MKNKFFLSFFLIFPLFQGCKATYPYEKIEESIKSICKSEYNLTVQTRIQGYTITAFIEHTDLTPEIESLSKEFIDNLSNVMNSLSRVVLSSDYPFEFIQLHIIESSGNGAYMTVIRYVDDIRRLLTGDISHGEYFKRLIIRTGIDTQALYELFVLYFFNYLNTDSALIKYDNGNTLLSFFNQQNRNYFVETITSLKTADNTCFIYVTTEEKWNIKKHSTLQSVGYGEYLIEIGRHDSFTVKNITPLYHISKTGAVLRNTMPAYMNKHAPLDQWTTTLPVMDIYLSDFLAEQISQRIKKTIDQDAIWSSKYMAQSITGNFVTIDESLPTEVSSHADMLGVLPQWLKKNAVYLFFNSLLNRIIQWSENFKNTSKQRKKPAHYGFFEFNIHIQEKILFMLQKQYSPYMGKKDQNLLDDINKKIVQQVLNRYGFTYFKEIRLINTNTGKTLIVTR